ncbi:amidohydrolase family protein [Erythrobacter sp. 3-20A1M]|uniref:amidohydrolase family protein n=1 Tax=Erythrobacter sp. 3-20A1M TaxID=2653850 RepID=UPI001BFC760D|nr:amidohydrolase family protein [Erythrobacter sp. 3-20A1M]QWC57628.1 amidohydrolase family protein [Erythrobacter sp. 3-20A1M]
MIRALFALIAALVIGVTVLPADARQDDVTLIRDARIFDATGTPAFRGDVLIRGGTIAQVAPHIRRPRGARVVDAKGRTLIPGLHDLHTHLRSPAYSAPEDMAKAWAAYLVNGVTTVNDYSLSAEMLEPIRAMTSGPDAIWAPHLNLAVRAGVPGGHGTEYGWGDFFTMKAASPRAAHLIMDRALPYRPDVVKVFADGWRYNRGPDLNSMNTETLAAIVSDAHARGTPVVTHTVTLEGAKVAAAAGVDAVVHGIGDRPADREVIDLMRKQGTAYVSTLVVYEPSDVRTISDAEEAVLSSPERAREAARAARGNRVVDAEVSSRWGVLKANLRTMHDAGIPIGVGTDAGISGVYHGSSTIREIGWLVQLGFTPAEALIAATRTSAQIMGQGDDHGTIEVGKRADLVLVDGRPDEDITDLWKVARVWKAGREVPLVQLRARRDDPAMTPLPTVRMPGPILTGARADGRTDLDTLPVDSTDAGNDHSDIAFVHRHGPTGDHPIFSLATFGASAKPFAQLVLPLTKGAVLPADASRFTGIEFTARGAGTYRLRLESYGLNGRDWFRTDFTAGAEEQTIHLPFAAFATSGEAQLDLERLRALRFELTGEPGGRAWLELSDVRFY